MYCGICVKAKELLCHTWREGKITNHDIWVNGTQDWRNFSVVKKRKSHAISDTPKNSLDFLLSRDQIHVTNDLDKQSKS